MDYTYFVAGFIGLVVGLVVGTVLAAMGWGGKRRLVGVSFGLSLLLNTVLLIDWTQTGSLPLGFLILDLGMIALFTLIGCAVGIVPPLAVRRLLRAARQPKS